MDNAETRSELPSGLVAFVKRDCPTCELIVPVLQQLAAGQDLTIFTQDDPSFPEGLESRDDTDLGLSYQHAVETVPTLLRIESGTEKARAVGWHRGDWEALTGLTDLGSALPPFRPGCGSLSVEPENEAELRVRFEGHTLGARRVEIASLEDEMEALFDRGWTDGLPVVPPTERRVLAMLEGTTRVPGEVVATVAPDLVECTVEKVAINAVLAGCKPEYLPVVLAAVEATCTDRFNIHGVLATTMGVGPTLIVNGPIRKALGMNAGINVLGQGNRANATIGRALQLVIRNVGGGRPGEIDRATYGNPGKLGLCFPEDEEGSPWEPLAADFGFETGTNTVTVFAAESPHNIVDQLSREPESLARSLAGCLRAVHHPKLIIGFGAMLVIGPEHARVFREGGWSKAKLKERLHEILRFTGADLMRDAGGITEGISLPPEMKDAQLPKFKPDALHIVHAGGGAGLFSVILNGWLTGTEGSEPVTREIRP
ncbi:MAG: thioredoxin family protein [Candidatus Binatia bacterium]|nr:thioredoxin family protein [Candidatus Binatia bacterium]